MQRTSTLSELAVKEPAAARVFYRNGLDFCCGGRRPLDVACAERGLDPDRVLAEIEAEGASLPSPRWDLRPLPELISFIVDTYHRRLRRSLPELIAMARKVEMRHATKPSCPLGLAGVLERMHDGVLDHLDKEERVLFPMIAAGEGHRATAPVHVMELEHDDHREHLQHIRTLTNGLVAPEHACVTWQALYLGLQQFEQELMEHIHLENNVLFRRALVE